MKTRRVERGACAAVSAAAVMTWATQAWAATGSGALTGVFGVSLLAGILTCFSQVIFMMVAVSAPERPPSVWMRVFAVANALIGAFVVFYFVTTTMSAMKSQSEYLIGALGLGGVLFGGFGLWWRREAPEVVTE